MRRPPLGTLLVVAVLSIGVVAGSAADRARSRVASGSTVDVVGATAVCPDLRQQSGGVLTTRVSVGSAPPPDGAASAIGSLQARRVSSIARPARVPLERPGAVAVGQGADIDGDGLVLTGTGALASGLEVEQITRGQGADDWGLAGLRCSAPQTDVWFVGGATASQNHSLLVLASVDNTPALVDVTMLSTSGRADPRPGHGLTIAPHTRVQLSLDTIGPDLERMAVHVVTRRGRVAAALRHSVSTGKPAGVDWVPQSAPPARTTVVPGFPTGPGTRELEVANPGTDSTRVQVQVTETDGQFVPTGLGSIDVPPMSTKVVSLSSIAKGSPLTVRVTSDSPVLAGGLVRDSGNGEPNSELAYTTGSPPLSGPALLTDLAINQPTESTLLLSALNTKASVFVIPIPVLGTTTALPAPRRVDVPAGRTVAVKLSSFLPPGASGRLALEIRPLNGSGPVWAARYLREHVTGGPLTTILDLQGPALRVPRPAALRDPQAAS